MSAGAFFLILLCCCQSSNTGGNQKDKINKADIDMHSKMSIEKLLQGFEREKVHIKYDFEFKKEKNYLGVPTKTFFGALVQTAMIDTGKYDVTFICNDGYSPTTSFDRLMESTGYIAIKDVAAKNNWDPDIAAKFAPAYLVWDIAKADDKHITPYGIVSIQFAEKKNLYLRAKPLTEMPTVLAGFSAFKDKCIKCHSINREGGELGPELNYPKNITEYWQIEPLKVFIKDPSAFRDNVKMPTLNDLDEKQIDLIVAYLQFMATQKKN